MSPLSWWRCRLAARRELRTWLDTVRRAHPPHPVGRPQPLVDREGRVLPDPEHDLYDRAEWWRDYDPGPTAAAGHGGARTTPAGAKSSPPRPTYPGRHGAPPTSVSTGPTTKRHWS